jgi:2,3-bisphosphoglycerate-independent phosphoglycerate mutase
MVGHTGVLGAAVQAIYTADLCLGLVAEAVLEKQGTLLITADHGNCEMMINPVDGSPLTAHTLCQVPFILVSEEYKTCKLREDAALCDIAPTMLEILKLEIPEEMTGKSIIASR